MFRCLVLALALLGPFTSATEAFAQQAPRLAPTTDALLLEAVAEADRFWEAAGYPARCPARLYVTLEPLSGEDLHVAAYADLGGCRLIFRSDYLEHVHATMSPGSESLQRGVLSLLCAVAVHERGHNLGFSHGSGGVMANVLAGPGRCQDWAIRRAVPQPRLSARDARSAVRRRYRLMDRCRRRTASVFLCRARLAHGPRVDAVVSRAYNGAISVDVG